MKAENILSEMGDILLEKEEILTLFLFFNEKFDALSPAMQSISRKLEEYVFSNFTISEIQNFENKGEP